VVPLDYRSAGGLLTHYSAAVYVIAVVLREAFLLVAAVIRRGDASGIGATLCRATRYGLEIRWRIRRV
jgi:hypothetical protein